VVDEGARVKLGVLTGVTLLSGAILVSEVAFTRYFSFRLWYHYAFMIISVALLGLGAAGTMTALARERLRKVSSERVLGVSAALFGIGLIVAINLLSSLNESFLSGLSGGVNARDFLAVAAYWCILFVPFFFAGCAISWAVQTYAQEISTLYAFDLVGAGVGAFAAALLLARLHPEQVLSLAAAAGLLSAALFASSRRRLEVVVWGLCALGGLLVAFTFVERGSLVGTNITPSKGLANDLAAGGRIVATRPSVSGRVDVVANALRRFAWGVDGSYAGPFPDQLVLRIDGDALTPITRLDGDSASWAFTDFMPSTLPYAIDNPKKVLVIGPGGGMDVVNGLQRGASEVTGVEINAGIIDLMRGQFAHFSGDVYQDPRVRLVYSDGRNFVENTGERYDLVQLTLVDTFAAISSGALALSEDFLYTTEAFRAYLRVLRPGGLLALGRTRSEALTLTALMDAATRGDGGDLGRQLFLSDRPSQLHSLIFLYKKTPFTRDEVAAGVRFVQRAKLRLVYAPGFEPESNPAIVAFLKAPDRDRFIAEFPGDITPETDDRPFYFRETKWSALLGTYRGGRGDILIILVISVVSALGLIVVPLAVTSPSALRERPAHLAFFALIGLGFIVLELAVMTRFVLFLGHPVRSLTVTLCSLLVFSGLGSAASRALLNRRRALPATAAMLVPFVLVAALGLAYGLWLDELFAGWMGLPTAERVAVAVGFLAPLGLAMGFPLPIGLRLLQERDERLVLWAWGLNGFASVIGSVGCIALAQVTGFTGTFAAAAVCYLLALLCLLRATRVSRGAPAAGHDFTSARV
jgi:SAM-dependent methyltransferase